VKLAVLDELAEVREAALLGVGDLADEDEDGVHEWPSCTQAPSSRRMPLKKFILAHHSMMKNHRTA